MYTFCHFVTSHLNKCISQMFVKFTVAKLLKATYGKYILKIATFKEILRKFYI